MKKKRSFLIIISLGLIGTIIACIFLLESRVSKLAYTYFSAVGSNAQDCAVLLSDRLSISQERFEELKKMSYLESTQTAEHFTMKKLIDDKELSHDIKNIYIMSPLAPNEVKYLVPKDKVDLYMIVENTPLDLVYVIDVLSEKYSDNGTIDYTEDMNRYSFQDEVTKGHIEARSQTYEYTTDEWGTTITGYAPFYATSGEYLGLIGVDIAPDEYINFKDNAVWSIFYLFCFCVAALLLEMIYLVYSINRMQASRIYTDALTEVYNRRFLQEKLFDGMKRKAKKKYIVFAMLDIDNFKGFNDAFGHNTGDDCLIKFAKSLQTSLPNKLSYVIRYGGEEFLACFSADSEESIKASLNQIQRNIASISLEETTYPITCSIGCCYCRLEEFEKNTINKIIKIADTNLYYVKENGRNHYKISNYLSDQSP